jgi:HIV Tat-specific factor 1
MTKGLPSEIDPIYLKEFFLKAGVVRLNHVTGEEKIKLYKNDDGTLKGDALVSYAKEESVAIAIEMLSERDIIPGHKITITKAEFQQRGDDYKKRAVQVVDPIAKIRYQVNQEKMLTWDDDIQGEGLRIVIVKNMFTPEIVLTDPEYLEMIREDITCECEQNAWKVKRMVIFEFHPEGVVEIKFEKGEHAEACIGVFNGRFYGGRMLECGYYDGKTNYKVLAFFLGMC